MTPLAQIHAMAKVRLDNLGMYVAMLSALNICAFMVCALLCVWSPFSGQPEPTQSILALLVGLFFGTMRDNRKRAEKQQKERYDELTAQLQAERQARGCGILA